MKPPTEPFRYDEIKWRKIKEALARIDVDADTATVSKQYGKQYPLRDELEWLAAQYIDRATARIPTVRQVIDATADDIKKIATTRDLFAYGSTWIAYLLGAERAAEIEQYLTAVEAELQKKVKRVYHGSELDVFRYEGQRGNASKPEVRSYLDRLEEVWHEIAGNVSSKRKCNDFVVACVVPVTNLSDKTVRDYLSRKKRKSKN